MNELKRVQKILMIEFCFPLLLALLIIVLYETNVLTSGIWSGDTYLEFVCLSVMELLTICLIPLALRLFKMKKVNNALHVDTKRAPASLLLWGSYRLDMLVIPLLVNLLLYYFFMKAAFGYMAIILFLCMFFVVPTLERCVTETKVEDNE